MKSKCSVNRTVMWLGCNCNHIIKQFKTSFCNLFILFIETYLLLPQYVVMYHIWVTVRESFTTVITTLNYFCFGLNLFYGHYGSFFSFFF